MNDVPPSVAIVFIIFVTIIVVALAFCDCVKQKSATTDSVVTSTESTTVSSTEADDTSTETTNAPTDTPTNTPTLTEEQARRAGAALMMRAATHAATGF